MYETLRIVTSEFSDFSILEKDIDFFSKYFIDIHTLRDDNWNDKRLESLKNFINLSHEKHLTPFINGFNFKLTTEIYDCSVLQHYRDLEEYGEDLDFLQFSSNTVSVMFWPIDSNTAFSNLKVLYSLGTKYPDFSFLFYFGELQEKTEQILNEIRQLPESIQRRILVVGAGCCFISDNDKFFLTYPSNFKEMFKYDSYPGKFHSLTKERILQLKKSSRCKNCVRNSACFGIPRISNLNEITPTSTSLKKQYISQAEFFFKRTFITSVESIKEDPYKPSDLLNSRLQLLQRRRLLKDFEGPNFYSIIDFSSSFYFNRPLERVDNLWQLGEKGLPTLNLQFIGKGIPEQEIKHQNDELVSKHGVTILSKIKFFKSWTYEDQKNIDNFTFETLKDIILSNGGDDSSISQIENDLFYNGKKFAGKEWKFVKNEGYCEDMTILCSYIKEKENVDKMNNMTARKQRTGITDEIPNITKELLISEFQKRAELFFNNLNNKIFQD